MSSKSVSALVPSSESLQKTSTLSSFSHLLIMESNEGSQIMRFSSTPDSVISFLRLLVLPSRMIGSDGASTWNETSTKSTGWNEISEERRFGKGSSFDEEA